MTPIEAAAKAEAKFDGREWLDMGRHDRERYVARQTAAVIAYLKALMEQGPSQWMLDAGLECEPWTPEAIWPAMLRAHITEFETKKEPRQP